MSAALLHKRHFDAPITEDCVPQCTSFTARRSATCLRHTPVLVFTPMRLSRSRSEYFTTNTKGEIVQIHNPLKQFKSTGRVAKKFASEILQPLCPVQLPASKSHLSKSYKSIPALKALQDETSLPTLLSTVSSACTDKEAAQNPVVSFIVQKLHPGNKNHNIDFYEEISDAPEFQQLKSISKLTYFHAYAEDSWLRVKKFIMEVIKIYHLDAILCDTPEEYQAAFGHCSDFLKADAMISYTILSLVHFALFNNRSHELHYWKRLSNEGQKTKYLLSLLDNHALRSISHHDSGVSSANRARLQFALPKCKELKPMLCLARSHGFIIKHYTSGIEFGPNWTRALFERSAENSKNADLQTIQLKLVLKNAQICAEIDPWCEEVESIARMKHQLKLLTESNCYVNPEDFVIR